jgi:glutamate synthase domain-containing protein 3
MRIVDLAVTPLRDLNQALHDLAADPDTESWKIVNPRGRHAIACGIDAPVIVEIDGHVGYYCAGMNKKATVLVNGNAGTGVAENMMSGVVHVKGDASQSAGATGCGGLLIIDGKTSARCGISLKGLDIIVKGSVGHMSGFMAQAGRIVVLGDAGEALGDSIYEAEIFVRGAVKSLGADCVEKPFDDETAMRLADLLARSGMDDVKPQDFHRYGSARQLYHFKPHNVGAY